MKQRNCMAFTIKKLIKVMAALTLIFQGIYAVAAPCDIKNSPPPFIKHDLTTSQATSISYCELCGFGYVTIVITNPYQGVAMTAMKIVENLGTSGLVYATAALAPTAVQANYSINGGGAVSALPTITGGGALLTWNFGSLLLPSVNGNNSFSTLKLTFPVISATSTTTPESLIAATRRIQATLSYTTSPTVCTATITSPVSTPLDTLPLREPIPAMTKLGRNVDAAQGSGSYTNTVYGNINDDVIWRIRVSNTGMAALQDMMLSDLMQSGGMNVYYACSSEGTATTAATNLNALNLILTPAGAPPAPPAGCVSAGNTVNNFVVNNPFGTPNNDSPDLVDIPANGLTDIFLVGKIKSSCVANTTNTASNLQWGCTLQPPAGGITTTSTGVTPANSTATLSTLVGLPPAGLSVQRQLRGINLAQPVGGKGTMTITIRNNSGGTIKNIKLRDVLPLEYVVDSTFTPTVVPSGGYGNYSGRTDTITWTNPAPGTFPLTSTNPADPLSNTQPQFTLTSSTVHPNYPDQLNMLRRGETLTINFRVVLIKSSYYDRVANLDVHTESPSDGTDPSNQTTTLSNSLYLTYEDFCFPGVTRNAPTYPYVDNFTAFPEDLDIDINGTVFILTNDPAQPVTLPVIVTNHGGHDARDYHVFVSFGATMSVQTAPAGCSVYALSGSPPQPLPWRAWILPSAIPATATVYQCTPGGALPNPMAPGNSTTLNFTVIKTSDPTRIAIDDLSFRADVVGEITLSNGTPLWFPTPIIRADGQTDRANDYSLDGIRARVIGFNLMKTEQGNCSENNPPPALPDALVQIGEECTFHIDTGGWFGFQTPGFTYIAVQNINVWDQLPTGQGYISSTNPLLTSTAQIKSPVLSTYGTATPPVVLSPNWINWSLNPVLPLSNRITQLDEWFRVNVVTRMLNSALNASAPPNLQAAISSNVLNSTFEAVFADTNGVEKIFLLGSGTVGYPLPPARTVNLTVTEPNLTVVKTVCNETLYGIGPTCSNFVPLANNGDTYDNYIYKISVTNGASAGGVTRAPAYDVIVTDTLDPSDLSYIIPFNIDGLDNDGDGPIDGADGNGEGTISDNIVKNGIIPTITFSYTHSSALQKINPGTSVNLYYRVDPDQDVQPGQTLVNNAFATYDSLSGPSGAQTVVPSASGTTGGARTYTSNTATANVQMILPTTQPKKIVMLSQPNHTVPATMPTAQPVSVGEEIKYELHTLLPIANLRNFVITDNLPVGVRCTEALAVNLSAPPYSAAGFSPGGTITPICTDTQVQWNFGTQALTNGSGISRYDFAINFIGRVENTTNTNNGGLIRNGGTYTVANAQYTDSTNTVVTLPYANVDVQVQEPNIVLTKTFTPVTGDAGDQVLVTVTATNTGTATAYNLRVLDNLTPAPHLSYIPGSVNGTDPPDVIDVTTLGASQPIFSWNKLNTKYAIAPGQTLSFTYKVLVAIGAQPLEVLSNNALNPMQAKWDSLPGQSTSLVVGGIGTDGSATGLRNGALPNAGSTLNHYETSTSATLSVPAVSIVKTDRNPLVVPAIGERKHFQVKINLPEGTTQSLSLADNLAFAGQSYVLESNATFNVTYTFSGLSTINGSSITNGVPTTSTVFTAVPADGASGTAQWNIGTVVTNSENDNATTAISPSITIDYYARIDNVAANVAGVNLRNAATASYINGATGVSTSTATSSTAQVTIVEPLLTISKAVVNVTNPGGVPAAGNTLRYTLSITAANGVWNSTAYDIAINDTISAALQYINGTATLNGAAYANPTITGGTNLNWSLANGNDIDIPAGSTYTLVYDVTVLNQPGTNLTNSSLVQWTSLNGASTVERDGSGYNSVGPAYDNYYTNATVASPPFADTTTFAKARLTDTYGAGNANVRVGDVVDYQLTINLPEGTTLATKIVDTLPQGLQFESVVSVNGVTNGPLYSNVFPFTYSFASPLVTGTPLTGPSTVTWNIGDITNAPDGITTNNDFIIVYRARVLNGALLQNAGAAQTLTNIATLSYTTASSSSGITRNASLTLQQPYLQVDKTSSPVSGSTIASATSVTYTVTVSNNGTAPAYDTQLRDIIPAGQRVAGITMLSTTLNGAVAANVTPTYIAATGVATWNFDTGVANAYTINAGSTLVLVYQVTADAGLSAGLTMTNQAQVQDYCSFDNNAVPSAGSVTGVRQCYGTSNTATSTLLTAVANPLGKANTQATAAIGDQFKYRITVPATPMTTALYDVRILDDLSASAADMSYVGITQISGPACTPVVTGAPKNLVFTCSGGGLDIPAGQQAVFDITVVLNDSTTNVNLTPPTFTNTASYTYNQINGDNTTQTNAGSGTTANMMIVGPNVTLQKSGPATMSVGVPGTFTLDVQNTGTGTAWDMTIVDRLPNLALGGMCDVAPTIVSVLNNGVALTPGTDYTSSYTPAPAPAPSYCTMTMVMKSAAASLLPNNHLIVTYQASLNATTLGGLPLTNVAGVTQWFSGDTPANVATGQIHTYTGLISDGTTGTLDNQDAHTLTTEAPLLQFLKSVINVTTGQNPGSNASPRDLLRYTLTIKNVSTLPLSNFNLTDELDRLNATAMFMPGTLNLISIPAGTSAVLTNATGGSKGTGLIDIRNLNITGKGGANDTLTIVFEVRLASVITNGTAVLNQAQLPVTVTPIDSDDPAINGSHDPSLAIPGPIDPTRTVITSAPVFRVQKTSQDITGDPMVLLAGERLRYTITVKNIGNESASNVILRDALPANTSYVAGSTQLNGVVVADVGIASALQTGMLINAPENLTAGVMRADASATVSNVATITFVVQINSNVLNGTIISNQGFVTGSGLGSGIFPEKPSDDPGTPAVDDPTLNVVGNFPLLIAQKVVAIQTDVNGDGIVDPLDVLRYTITISNLTSIPATGVIFTDLVPANTTYVANTVTLNSLPIGVPDGGVSPLITGIGVESPVSPPGTINAKSSAVITFDVQVNAGVVAGTVISNQGNVTSVELPNEPTDADGNPSNGHQPTTIIVGYAQQLSITKQVTVVGGGPALAGGQLEYLVRVTNPGTVSATNVIITDNLGLPPLSTQVTYVAGSATLNGSTTGVTVTGALITTTSTSVAPGATLQLRFRVTINAGLAMGTTITNTGMVAWNTPTLTASASVSIDVGGVPGSANLNGHVWYDANHSTAAEPTELNLAGWLVEVYRNNILLGSTLTDANGLYTVAGLTPTTTTNFEEEYAIRFSAPGAVVTTAKLGLAVSPYTNGLQQIGAIIALSGSSLQNLNLPITPDGVVYNSILRSPASGVILNMVRINTTSNPPSTIVLPKTCFDDPEQQGQVTIASGYYKFDINFTDPSCQQGSEYLIVPSSPAAYMPGQSLIIPPLSDFSTLSFSVPNCPSPATLVTVALPPPSTSSLTYCESQLSEFQPGLAVPAKTLGTNYFLRMLLRDTPIPQNSQLFNNHIAVDPRLDNAVSITKIAALQNVTKGQLIPYTITVSNTLPVTLTSMNIVDTFPPGFKYVAGSGRIDGLPVEPVSTTRDLTWGNLQLVTNTKRVIQLMLIVGSGVKEGKYVNRARVINAITNGFGSPEASATVRVIPDPTLDCSDVIGKVFDDANLNGYQDEGEKGLAGVRVVTARGLIVTTDKYGRFHLTCAVVPDPDRGSNFILKIDDRSLPSGYRITTENPRVLRATRGKMLKFNFGAAIHKVVKLDVADGVFEPGTSEMRVQWKQRVELLLTELKKAPSVLRLSYLAETETEGLVDTRLDLLKSEITNLWKKKKGKYDLTIETEVFWRTGSPPGKSEVSN